MEISSPLALIETIPQSLPTGSGASLLLLISIAAPFVAGLFILFFGSNSEALTKNTALVGFSIPVIFAPILWGFCGAAEADVYLFVTDIDTGLRFLGISLKLGLNGLSMPLYILASVVGLAAGLYAINTATDRLRHYLILLLVMHGGIMGIFASIDIFFFYFFHEIALIPTFVMIGMWGGRGRRSGAMEMAVYLTLGAMLSLIGLIALYVQSGAVTFDIPSIKEILANRPLPDLVQENIFALLMFGFGILVSLWPFHSWAPRSYGVAPTSVAMMHAGVLKKFGLYGLIQIGLPLLPQGSTHWSGLLVWLALGNIIIIGLVTLAQRDLKQMIGYSSVMHMGYAFLGIACLSSIGVGGAVMLMFAHGLSVALLFLLSTCIYHRTKTFDMDEMGGLASRAPVLAAFFVIAIMASIGLPGFANFWGELTIFIGLWEFKSWLVIPAIAGIVISAIYGLRAVASVFFGQPSDALIKAMGDDEIGDLKSGERAPALILITVLLCIGFWPQVISNSVNEALSAKRSIRVWPVKEIGIPGQMPGINIHPQAPTPHAAPISDD